MYLKSLKLVHFRKFDEEDNTIEFVSSKPTVNPDDKSSFSSVATNTTLIIGKNNVGKSTVIQALRKLTAQMISLERSDFCYPYLKRVLRNRNEANAETPYIEFCLVIGYDSSDLIAGLGGFITAGQVVDESQNQTEVFLRYVATDEVDMLESIRKIDSTIPENQQIECLLRIIGEQSFETKCMNSNGDSIKGFKLSKIVDFNEVPATDVSGPHCLTDAFNRILKYQSEALLGNPDDRNEIQKHIDEMNEILTSCIGSLHGNDINEVLGSAVRGAEIKAQISADITLDKIRKNLVKYEYEDSGLIIPEDQFGLGYTRLVMVIAHILDYVDQYNDKAIGSKVSLIVIEEPETHMHPQMQELFIQYIENTVDALIRLRDKSFDYQLVITTHSDHIVHSKIHSGGKFDFINYLREYNGLAKAVALSDAKISPDGQENVSKNLKFLKKHVCLSVASVFFADAIVIVEGLCEYSLLPYYIAAHEGLRDKYVSVVSVNGAHAFVYENLIEILSIPAVIITDLDIVRESAEDKPGDAEKYPQICSLKEQRTTNATLKHFAKTDILGDMTFPLKSAGGSIKVYSQGEIAGYYPTSFEEAMILTNYNDDILVQALHNTKPKVFQKILGDPECRENLRDHSFKCQCKLNDKKSDFAGELLYEVMTHNSETDAIKLPDYISDALDTIAVWQ